MKIIERELPGVFEIQLNPLIDERGFFLRTYDIDVFKVHGLNINWVQENHSFSKRKGIIRGLHFQFPPHSEAKLVRVIRGSIYDVYVDLRTNSPTFGKWGSLELSDSNKKVLYIPRNFAHGFCTLADSSEVLYKVDNFYNPEAEGGIIWNDPDLEIDWPTDKPLLSKRDANLPLLSEFKTRDRGL